MAERVGEHGDSAIGGILGRCLQLGTRTDGPLDGGIHVIHDDIGMNRRPVPRVAPLVAARACGAGRFRQEIDRRRPSQ